MLCTHSGMVLFLFEILGSFVYINEKKICSLKLYLFGTIRLKIHFNVKTFVQSMCHILNCSYLLSVSRTFADHYIIVMMCLDKLRLCTDISGRNLPIDILSRIQSI